MVPVMFGALIFTVALLFTTAYFLLGGIPLLTLKHDVPLDAKFIRNFFNVYYKAAFVTAAGAAACYAMWDKPAFAAGAAIIAVLAVLLGRRLLVAMETLGARIELSDATTVQAFRRVHVTALAVNLAQLAVLVWGLGLLSKQLS